MRFEVLGPLRIQDDGALVPLTSGRQRALFASLLIAGGETVAADRLIEDVWGEDLPSDPANTLQHGVAQLRKLLEPGRKRGDSPTVLISEGTGYRLDLEGHSLDTADFEEHFERGRSLLDDGAAEAASEQFTRALALWRGPAYGDFAYSDFARAESERLEELRVQCRELLVDALGAAKGPDSVIADLEGLIVEFPYREGLWARLMRALYQAGRQADALRVYGRASRALGDELGIEPSVELRDLEEQILLQDPSLAPAVRKVVRHNLPIPATSLIGRDDDLERLLGFLETARLATLLGPGGSGKTRLAIEAAHRVVDEFGDGAWLVRLDDLLDPELLAATVGAVVAMPEDRDRTVAATLSAFLSEKRALLILDNCEHLIGAVAGLVESLLADCPALVVMATSQEALNVTGEQRVPVPPLQLPGDTGSPFDDIEVVPAVQLFLERAAAINPDVDRSAASIAAVANIVRALDGIPLAIELAAARTDLLSPAELAGRLADRFEILDAGPRDAPQRQRTLRDAVDWSYGLLDVPEQAFFKRLAIFAGCVDVAAAAAVTETSETEALAMIGRLAQRSLVNRQPTVAGESRYRLLETLRIFGTELLVGDGELDRARDLHLEHFADRTQRMDDDLAGPNQSAAFATLLSDQDNMRAAMAWSLESGNLAPGVRLAARAGRFWDWRGSLAEAVTWANRFLDTEPDETLPDLALLIGWAGYFVWELGEEERAVNLADRAAAIAIAQGDLLGKAIASTFGALHARVRGDDAEAVSIAAGIRNTARAMDNVWLAAWADNHDGLALLGLGDIDGAEAAAQSSLNQFRDLGDFRATGWALTVLAQIAHARSDLPKVVELADQAARLSRDAGDGRNAAWALELAADAAAALGDDAESARLASDAAALLRERGVPVSPWRRAPA